MAVDTWVWDAPQYLGAIASIFFLANYKRFSNLGLVIGWFVCFTFGCEFMGTYFAELNINNLFVVHIYTLGAFVFCSLFFQRLYRMLEWDYYKTWHLLLGVLLIILNTIFIQHITTFNSYSKTVSQVLIIAMCMIAYSLLTVRTIEFEDKSSVKVFTAAILLSCAMSMSIYLFSNLIASLEQSLQVSIWLINVLINSIVQLLFVFGMYKQLVRKKNDGLAT